MKTILKRTQIYLPIDLREEIDKQRIETGESLAEFLRQAAEEKIAKNKKKKVDLKKLADEFIGSSDKTNEEIEEWLNDIREDRRLSDERMMRRWDEAIKNSPLRKKSSNHSIMVVRDKISQRKKKK